VILLRDREEPVGGLSSQIIAAAREGDLPRFLRLAEKYGSLERAQSLVRSSGLPVTRITRGRVYITDGGDPEDGEGEPDG
jgi:hypothetical protein